MLEAFGHSGSSAMQNLSQLPSRDWLWSVLSLHLISYYPLLLVVQTVLTLTHPDYLYILEAVIAKAFSNIVFDSSPSSVQRAVHVPTARYFEDFTHMRGLRPLKTATSQC